MFEIILQHYQILLGLSVAIYVLYWLSLVGRRSKGLPPGPPTLPVIGNLHLLDKNPFHLQLQIWAKEYGPIYSLKFGTRNWIVLNSDQAVRDLFDKKGSTYAARPDFYLNQVWQGLNAVMRTNDDTWRMQRKLFHGMLNRTTLDSYTPYQDLESIKMLCDMIEKPTDFFKNIRRYTTSLTTTMIYGWRTPVFEVRHVVEMFEATDEFMKLIQRSLFFDWFPALRVVIGVLPDWIIPGQKQAKYLFGEEKRIFTTLFTEAKKGQKEGILIPCFVKDIISVQEKEGFSDLVGAFVAGLGFQGGSDTTAHTIHGFIKAMALFPDVQRKAQMELDSVVGPDRLPNVDDQPNLPYIHSCIKEILRWQPVNPTGVAHSPTKDDEYLGYKIPQGSGVVINVWTIHNDPKRYDNPRDFNPDRYKGDTKSVYESAISADVSQRDQFGFGSGRRMCPGLNVAERSLFLALARIAWGFNITKAKDSQGLEIPIDRDAILESQASGPMPFKCSILPRNTQRQVVIENEWINKQQLLDGNGQYKKVTKVT